MINYKNIAISIITKYPKWYKGKLKGIDNPDKVRGDLALKLITEALKKTCKIVVSDSKSSKGFKKELLRFNGITLINRKTSRREQGKRQALKKASSLRDVKAIVITEPEKVSLIRDCLDKIVKPILDEEADVVVPKRNEYFFKETYPKYQYESEVEGNNIYNGELRSHELLEVKDIDYDMYFGPKVVANNKRLLSIFTKKFSFSIYHISTPKWYFDPEELPNVNFFPVVSALKKGFKIANITVPFKYPRTQKLNEEGKNIKKFMIKRKVQRVSLTIELLHFVSYLEKYKGIRVKLSNSK